jgi:hypothetical protein
MAPRGATQAVIVLLGLGATDRSKRTSVGKVDKKKLRGAYR